jgi:hypothetical protein
MAVGFPANKWDIDNRAGVVAKNLRDALREVEAFNAYLATMDDQELGGDPNDPSSGVGYSSEDIQLLRASFIDLTKLSRIAHGQDEQVGANDFFWNAKHLLGPQ